MHRTDAHQPCTPSPLRSIALRPTGTRALLQHERHDRRHEHAPEERGLEVGARLRAHRDGARPDRRGGEDREDEDALLIETFIAVGCSSSADRVVQALLPYALRHGVQPKLAGATVRLVFDDTGKLQAVTA